MGASANTLTQASLIFNNLFSYYLSFYPNPLHKKKVVLKELPQAVFQTNGYFVEIIYRQPPLL
ncbi:MAG: hypothetical protein WAQ98_04975, partial [Blastocatellia bacterium]